MRKTIFAALLFTAATMFTACQKEENGGGVTINSFDAISESASASKTYLDPDQDNNVKIYWESGDNIMVYGSGNTGCVYGVQTINAEDAQQARFFSSSDGATGNSFTAFYPSSIAASSSSVTLPVTQAYRGHENGTGYITGFPMVAKTTVSSGTPKLYFKNLCAMLILRLKGPDGATINSITINEPTYPYANPIAGNFTVGNLGSSTSSSTPSLTGPSSLTHDNTSVTLTGANYAINGDNASNYHLFYFYLPEGDHKWLNVSVNYDYSGTTKTYTKTLYARNYGTSISNFSFARSNWAAIDVDLTAEMNNTSGIGKGLIYSAENLVFNGDGTGSTPNPIAGTNTLITKTYSSYTILIDVTPDEVPTGTDAGSRMRTLFCEMSNRANEWRGLVIRYIKSDDNDNIMINAEGPQFGDQSSNKLQINGVPSGGRTSFKINNGVRNRFAVVVNSSGNTYSLYAKSYNEGTSWLSGHYEQWGPTLSTSAPMESDRWITANATNYKVESVVGGDQLDLWGQDGESSTDKKNFDGTIHQIKIYNRVLSDTERDNWLSTGSITGSSK